MRKRQISKYKTSSYIKDCLEELLPPEDLTVSQWAEKFRVLDSKTAAMPGPWHNSMTPYLIGIMDEFNVPTTEKIVFVKPTQVGGTEALHNMIGYVVAQNAAPSMIVYPTEDLARSVSENRLQPMLRISPQLEKHFKDNDSELLELQFDNMYLSLTGANSPTGISSKPIKFLFLDEVDKYPARAKKEADPIKLATERTKTFPDRKIFVTSTPTLKTGHIWQELEKADEERHYFVPCPHCGKLIELKFSQIKWSDDKSIPLVDRAERAFYVCQECGAVITDAHKQQMLRAGKWKAIEKKTKFPKNIAFWMNTLYSPFVRFSEIAKEFLLTKDDSEAFQNFVNSWLAEPWEDTKVKSNADLVLERQTDLEEYIVPDWCKLLTAGVDVQESSLYWTIRAFGDYITSQNIAHGQVMGFNDLEEIMNREYLTESGERRIVQIALIDSGDNTDAVYDFCACNSDWAYPVKGSSHPLMSHFKISKINRSTSMANGMQLVIVDGGKYMDMIYSRMNKPNGRGSWMVYKNCDRNYAEQVTAEHKIKVKTAGGRVTEKWELKKSHADNHYGDCEKYAMAAADIKGVRTLHLDTLEMPQETKPAPQSNNEDNWINVNEGWLTNE